MTKAPTAFPDLVARLDENLRELFEERAAVREFDGGLRRDHAECAALLDTLRLVPLALVGVTVLQLERGGVPFHVVASDVGLVHVRAATQGAAVLGVTDLRTALRPLHGMAQLSRFG